MNWMTKAVRFQTAFTLAFALLLGVVIAPKALAQDDTFGVGVIDEETELGNRDIRETIASIINVALGLLGIIALVIILAGGFQWMTAGGNEEKVGAARKMIFSGIIGLAIILSSFAIARFVLTQLSTATESGVVPET